MTNLATTGCGRNYGVPGKAQKEHNGMSNARKARGTKTPDERHSWAKKTYTNPLPVRGAWPTAASGPVIWADATGRPDVRDLARGRRRAT
jgi:hypothetical protein